MCSGSVENDSLTGDPINQQPVCVNMTLEESCEVILKTPKVTHKLLREDDFPHRRLRYAIASLAVLKR